MSFSRTHVVLVLLIVTRCIAVLNAKTILSRRHSMTSTLSSSSIAETWPEMAMLARRQTLASTREDANKLPPRTILERRSLSLIVSSESIMTRKNVKGIRATHLGTKPSLTNRRLNNNSRRTSKGQLKKKKERLPSTKSKLLDISDEESTVVVSWSPGDFSQNLTSLDRLLLLSNGLSATRIATAGEFITFQNGGNSTIEFHKNPDGAAIFETPEGGGWYYVSNAENSDVGDNWDSGGVGAIEFNSKGEVVSYTRIANYTKKNCSGGKTPWNSWVTCEEFKRGVTYQVDPTGKRPVQGTGLGTLGMYESFAYDDSTAVPTFYVTRDAKDGALTRFTPDDQGMQCYHNASDPWCTLDYGTIDYLLLLTSGDSHGYFIWTTNITAAKENAKEYYPHSEGIDVADGMLYFTAKMLKRLVILDLKNQTYQWSSTKDGAFDKQPDQVARVIPDDNESILFFCEDGSHTPGVFGRDTKGSYFTILNCIDTGFDEEATGLAFSLDGKHMYVAFQTSGFLYDVVRIDGLPFSGAILDIKYHST